MLDLITQIYKAFESVPYPGDDHLVCHDCDECRCLRDTFKRKKPNEIGRNAIIEHEEALPLFSDEAKRYYLPAFLAESISIPKSNLTILLVFSFRGNHRWSQFLPLRN